MIMKKEQVLEKLTKSQVKGIRRYRRMTIQVLSVIIFLSLWFKMGFTFYWHFNDVIVEIIVLFFLILMGILANVKNDFPIFQMRKFRFTKEFTYSIITFFSLLFVFILYKNIVDSEFISYLAELSFHDLCTILVFLFPIVFLFIYIIYFSFCLIYQNKRKNTLPVYSDQIEASIHYYKSFTVKVISLIMLLSLWMKVGLHSDFSFYDISTEVFSLFTILILWVMGNLDNQLSPFYNCYFKGDRYFIYSFLLPYLLILIYMLFSSDFRLLIFSLSIKEIFSFWVYMGPLFFVASFFFYIGFRHPSRIKETRKKINFKKNKVRVNAMVSLILTLLLVGGLFCYTFVSTPQSYQLENILQAIIIFIPLCVIVFLVLYSGIREINK